MGSGAQNQDTPALEALRKRGIPHEVVHTARARSVEEAAAMRQIPVPALLKTIVVRRGQDDYLFILVPGDRSIDWGKLRSHLGVRRIPLPDAAEALAVTGYERGTITPFGADHLWPVIADASIATGGIVSIGGGAHGTSVKVDTQKMLDALEAEIADVTRPG